MAASFPDSVWDGTSLGRSNFSVSRAPDGRDYDRMAEEVIAQQKMLKEGTYPIPNFFSWYIQENARFLTFQANGGIIPLATSQPLSNGVPVPFTGGISRVLIEVEAGSDTAGTITITGDTVDRNTGVISASDTESITISGTTTDNTTTTTNGTIRWGFENAYMTEKWFEGLCSISTTDTNLTVTVYAISYEEHADLNDLTVNIFDISAIPINAAARIDAFMDRIAWNPTTKVTKIDNVAFVEQTAAVTANTFYRLRKGNLGEVINYKNREGWFANIAFYPDNQKYWTDVTIKIWGDITHPIP